MKRLLIVLMILALASPAYGIVDFKRGTGTNAVLGTTNRSDVDYAITNYLQDPLDRLLVNFIRGCTLTRTSATVITVSAGELTGSNGAGTIKRMRQNTATVTMDMTVVGIGGIDAGSAEANSTWYSLYAILDADATTFTVTATVQGTALAGAGTIYRRYIGSVYNNAAGDLKNFYWFGNGNTPLVMWDVPVEITTVPSASAWSGATSCAAGMPSSSICGVFHCASSQADGIVAGIWIRVNGSTGAAGGTTGGLYDTNNAAPTQVSAQLLCLTDSSQQIQYYNQAGDSVTTIQVEGFYINR